MRLFFIILAFLMCSHTSTFAQWQKVLGKNNVPYQFMNISKIGNDLVVAGPGGIHYSRDNGKIWRVMRPEVFSSTDEVTSINCLATQQGIFALILKKTLGAWEDSTFFVFTPNFGRTWEITKLDMTGLSSQIYNYPCKLLQSPSYVHVFISGTTITNYSPVIFKLRKDNRQIEYSTKNYNYNVRSVDYFVSDKAEYINYATNDSYIDINYHNGTKVTKLIPYSNNGNGYFVIKDSLLCYDGNGFETPVFSNDFGQTWYRAGSTFPIIPLPASSGSRESYFRFSYKDKLYYIAKAKIYSSADKGLSWNLESSEIQKYSGLFNPAFTVQDSILTFSTCSCDIKYAFNLVTKNITEYNTELVQNSSFLDLKDKISKTPDGKLIKRALTSNPYINFVSIDRGATWALSKDYPYFFDKIQVNDSTFYAFDYFNPFDSYDKPVVRFVNNIRKDTLPSSFLAFINWIQKGDTIVAQLKTTSDSLAYSTQKPYTTWTKIKVNGINKLLFFDNKKIYSYYDDQWGTTKLDLIGLDGTIQTTQASQYNSSMLNISEPNNLWFGSTGSIYNTKDLGVTKRVSFIPLPDSYSNISRIDAGMLAVIKKNNIPEEKLMVVVARNTPYMSSDSGKTWIKFNLGIDDAFTFKVQQVDSFLFAITDRGMYRRSLADITLRSVSGTVYLDLNSNNVWDVNEVGVLNAKIYSKTSGAFTYTDSLGRYNMIADVSGSDTIMASFENRYATILPNSYVLTKSDTGKNFALKLLPNVNDLKINLTALTPPRPGFNNVYALNYKNVGSKIANGAINLQYHVNQTFITASTPPSSRLSQQLSWNFVNLQPNESRSINVTFKTSTNAIINSQMTDIALIDPLSIDTFKTDNIDSLVQTVVGSFDPNDKQVSFKNSRTPSVIDPSTELIYTIRFQNTGNYPADFVKVVDTLSDKLDLSTFRLIATSHKGTVAIRVKNVLTFDFNPIYLPDSSRDEAGSHGFVKFAIKPKRALTNNEDIQNTGFIYFDYNSAVVTNTIKAANVKGVGIFTPSVSAGKLIISPNPAQQTIRIKVDNPDFKVGLISIYDLSGRLILSKLINKQDEMLSIENLKNGEYICTIKSSDNKLFVQKFLKVD